jgi:hypothetical protein
LRRHKKLPSLKSLLRKRTDRKQSVGQLKGALAILSEQYGILIRKRKKKAKAHGQ